MNFRSLFTESLPLTLLSIFAITTAIAQAPIFPFPAQPPVASLSTPSVPTTVQQNQVAAQSIGVTQILQRPFLIPEPIGITPENTIQAPQRPFLTPSSNTPTNIATTVAAPSRAPQLLVLSEYDMLNMDLKTEFAYQTHIRRQVQTNKDIHSFIATMIQNLGNSGWSTGWQGTRASTYLTDFYHSGGQHLRLEVESATDVGYRILLYRF